MIAKSPSKRIRTSSVTSPLIVTGCATSLRYSPLSSSEPSGVEHMKSSAKISARRFTSPFCTDAVKSRFRAVSVSRSRCVFTFVCMAISSGVRRFLVQSRNEALIFDPSFLKHRVSPNVHPVVPLRWNVARPTVGLVVGRHVLLRVLRLEQGPPPPISPQVVLGEPPLRVLHHHEPDLDVLSPGGLSRCEVLRADGGDVLHQDGTVGKLAVPAVRLDVFRSRVDVVHLVHRFVRLRGHGIRAQVQERLPVIKRQ